MTGRPGLCGAAALLVLLAAPAAADDPVTGTWGVVDAGGEPRCHATDPVLVFADGRYYRVLPEVGSSTGTAPLVIARSRYRLDGQQLVIEPSRDLHSPEPRQVFTLEQMGQTRLVRRGRRPVVYRPCPDGVPPPAGQGSAPATTSTR